MTAKTKEEIINSAFETLEKLEEKDDLTSEQLKTYGACLAVKHEYKSGSLSDNKCKLSLFMGELEQVIKKYAETKKRYSQHPTAETAETMENQLCTLLYNVKETLDLLRQSLRTEKELEILKKFIKDLCPC